MAGNLDWKKAQSERLEEERKQSWGCARRGGRSIEPNGRMRRRRKKPKAGHWGSSWWRQRDWSQEDRSGSSGARGSQEPPPEPTADPTTSSTPLLAIEDFAYPTRNHGEDLTALRAAAMTPVSFMPQRHVTMALGRPVLVLSGI